jgi:hypothetical protein
MWLHVEREWSGMCDDDCRICGARHMSPFDTDDLTFIVEDAAGWPGPDA